METGRHEWPKDRGAKEMSWLRQLPLFDRRRQPRPSQELQEARERLRQLEEEERRRRALEAEAQSYRKQQQH